MNDEIEGTTITESNSGEVTRPVAVLCQRPDDARASRPGVSAVLLEHEGKVLSYGLGTRNPTFARIGGTELMGADIPDAQPMRSAYLSLRVTSDGEAARIFSALNEGGELFMPLQETFFATRFGQL